MRERIFVQIPAYRDRELVATVDDLMRTAADPTRLRVAIAWQFADDERHLARQLTRWPNVEVLPIPARDSRGCNWARSLLQVRWDGEPYTLLLDSHHRFMRDWDAKAIELHRQLRRRGIARPVLTAYLPPYDPDNDPRGRQACMFKIALAERCDGIAFRLTGHPVADWRKLAEPVAADFVSLHFLFAEGAFNREIEFDPTVYFFADEVAIALRAFTHGYELFHPHVPLGWHLYDRATRVTHWSDHSGWEQQNRDSLQRLRQLFAGQLTGRYGIGRARSIAEYESRAGLRLVQ